MKKYAMYASSSYWLTGLETPLGHPLLILLRETIVMWQLSAGGCKVRRELRRLIWNTYNNFVTLLLSCLSRLQRGPAWITMDCVAAIFECWHSSCFQDKSPILVVSSIRCSTVSMPSSVRSDERIHRIINFCYSFFSAIYIYIDIWQSYVAYFTESRARAVALL